MENHWLLLLVGGVLLVWGLSLVLVHHRAKRRVLKALMEQEAGIEEAPPASDLTPRDLAALEVIRTYRRRYLMKLWPDTEFSFQLANDMSLELIREIARVYYSGEERPELKASLADLVALYNRVGGRLASWLETFPIRTIKDVELGTALRAHEIYRSVKNHPGYQFVKRHHLDRLARWGWAAYNYVNPWYWGRKAALEVGKEVTARLLLAKIADLVGEEAMRLYGRRPLNSK